MKPETQIHLADLRELLVRHVETWRTVLVAAHARHKSSSAMAEASPLSPAGQQAVDANEAQMRIALDELWLCEAAVSRLGCGSYGDCRDCGQGVDLLRLLVKPHAECCEDCEGRTARRASRRASAVRRAHGLAVPVRRRRASAAASN